jgi:hypothetical protein
VTEKRIIQHPENRIIPNQMFTLDPDGELIPAELMFTVPEAGDYDLVFVAGHPFLQPYVPQGLKP